MDDASLRMRVAFDERIGDSRAELTELLARCGTTEVRTGYLAELAARLPTPTKSCSARIVVPPRLSPAAIPAPVWAPPRSPQQ